jgi:hypothetical protein
VRDLLDNPFVRGVVFVFLLAGVVVALFGAYYVCMALAALFGFWAGVVFGLFVAGLGVGTIIWAVEKL